MRYVEAGGLRMSVIGLGTWQFGTPEWGWGSQFGPAEALAVVERARALGISLIDTAELYGGASRNGCWGGPWPTRRPGGRWCWPPR